jgi:hypothetical protein
MALLARQGELPLSLLATRQEVARDYAELLPELSPAQWRRLRGEQEIVVRYEPEQALATLPDLLADPDDRERLLTLLDRLMQDERVQRAEPTAEQRAMLERIRSLLGSRPAPRRQAPRRASSKKTEGPHDHGQA